ncbi:MAG TPA: 4Fe-4S dicluster domain-containing protein [Polyangiaceae bacterium]|nr:4Fe-4S dicluster domain-containing protein [Polyangiaceae bacterium]
MSKRARYPWEGGTTPDGAASGGSLGDRQQLEVSAPEFPKGHVTTPPSEEALYVSRRGLIGAMASTMALVGAEGCRRPIEKIVPYTKMPEDVIPGVPTHYSTVIQRRGEAVGLVVESHEGRPTKIEGNGSHPASLGKADLVAQATILDLYDPERSTTPRKAGEPASWGDFEGALAAKLATYDADQGARLRVLMQPTLSATVLRMRAALAQRFPKARVHTWSAVSDSNAREGARLAFGQPTNTLYAYDKARVILSLDSDFLQTESGNVRANWTFSNGRRLRTTRDPMSRLYVVEPARTTTGNCADHRLRLPASDVERYAHALLAEIAKKNVALGEMAAGISRAANAEGIPPKWLAAVANDLVTNRGRALVVVGSRQPPTLHAIAHVLNAALGAVGTTVAYAAVADPEELDAAADLKVLTDAISANQVDGLIILGGNPVYDAPADLAFGDKIGKLPLSVHASLFFDETSEKCAWHVPRAHELESWGDARSLDGTVGVQQPLIAPLYAGRSDVDLLALMARSPEGGGYEAVRATVRDVILKARGLSGCGPFNDAGRADCRDAAGNPFVAHLSDLDRHWNRALATGIAQRSQGPLPALSPRQGDILAAIHARQAGPRVGPGSLEVTFAPCPKMVDGRHANNTWLQEMPDPVTKLVWDNAAILSPATAKELGLESKDVVSIAVGARSIRAAVWVVPGQADHSIALTLGWGRKKSGRIGNGRGFDAYPLRTTDALGFAVGARVSKTTEDPYFFAKMQGNDSAEDRPIAHEATLAEYRQKPNFAELDSPPPRALPLWSQVDYSKGHQWGMSIDLNACTGCNACVIACMAENNVPVVGKLEVWRGRGMHWLRIDRYYVERADLGATEDDPLVINEPVMCVHCEEAPCENVCPVNATTHGPEGLNEMAYNRCIGTRYCANNCPYKVRKFNYLNWHNDSVWKETGGLPETLQMQQNPNVTVRFRGVMEKCTYCVQRIQSAKIKAKREYRDLKDGEIVTACEQTCPADAIVFGDLNDINSRASRASRTDRRFGLLADLGTRPRTTHLGKVRNPNPEMA